MMKNYEDEEETESEVENDQDEDDLKKVAKARKHRFPGAASTVPDKMSGPRRRKPGADEVRIMGAIGRGEL